MLETLKSGTSIKDLKPLRLSSTINHGISRTLEELRTCKSGALMMDGSNTSSMMDHSSAMFKRANHALVFINKKMKKLLKLESKIETTRPFIKNGRSSMLIRLKPELKDSTKTLDSISIDHSILFQDSQCTELLNVLVTQELKSRDIQREEKPNNSFSTRNPRLSNPTTGRTEQLKFQETATTVT
jgi:hypothetical protein